MFLCDVLVRFPKISFDPLPTSGVRFARNITYFLTLKRERSNRNFGHAVFENLAGIYHAMESFDLLDAGGRILLFQNVSVSDYVSGVWNVSRYNHFYFFPHNSAFIEEYPSGTCFQRMVVGHAGVASLFSLDFSRHRAAHYVRFRRFYLKLLNLEHVVTSLHYRPKVVVNVYPKIVRGNHVIWKDVCKLSTMLTDLFPDVEFRCIALHSTNLELQAQLISAAAVHVWPNGESICLVYIRAFCYHASLFMMSYLLITSNISHAFMPVA
jgi:hypothetical protein